MPLLPGEPLDPEAVGEDAPHEAAVVLVVRVPDGLLLGQGLGQLLPAASRLVGRRGRGHVGQLLRGRCQQIRRRDAHDGPVGLGEAGALERDLELRPDGRHHGSGTGRRRRGPHDPRRQPEEVVRELHPVLVLIVRSRARQQDLEADLREEGQPNRQQVLEPVHQQPHGVDGEDLLPRKRAQPQLAGPSGPARAQLCHSGLGARSARLLQRHCPDGAEAQAAPDEIRQLAGHGANWFELNKLLSIEK